MSASHLLSLSALHAAAPGVLDIVFGADGDFEGAPKWRGPIWRNASEWLWLHALSGDCAILRDPDGPRPTFTQRITTADPDGLALDCRIPSIAARLAGLCARALGMSAAEPGPWYWTAREVSAEFGQYGAFQRWELSDGALRPLQMRREYNAPTLPADAASSRPAFLAALTLSLADRIGALGAP